MAQVAQVAQVAQLAQPAVTQPAVVQPAVAQFATQPQERMLGALMEGWVCILKALGARVGSCKVSWMRQVDVV